MQEKRPQASNLDVAAVILAAGGSRRMGRSNKLLQDMGGVPLIQRTVNAAQLSRAAAVVVVTGFEADQMAESLAGFDLKLVFNPDWKEGLGVSLKAGVSAVPEGFSGTLVLLGDMPRVSAAVIDLLIAGFEVHGGEKICVPVFQGRRGNPVLWPRRFFPELLEIPGDQGGREVLRKHPDGILKVDVGTPDIHFDVDGPEDLDRL